MFRFERRRLPRYRLSGCRGHVGTGFRAPRGAARQTCHCTMRGCQIPDLPPDRKGAFEAFRIDYSPDVQTGGMAPDRSVNRSLRMQPPLFIDEAGPAPR